MRILCMLAGAVTCALVGGSAHGQVNLNVYGDFDYIVTHADETQNSLQLPRVDLFLTAALDRLTFLSEVMLEVGEDNAFGVDVERVEVGYTLSEWLRIRIGRFHTALGYYNDAYHHGRYFQVAVDRPEIVNFEDEGGLIPAHSIGLHLDGRFHIGRAGALRYDIDVANGRGRTPDEVTNKFDPDNAKAWNLRLRWEPAFLEGLIIGGNAYFDSIADSPMIPGGLGERIYGGHLAYLEHNVHFIGELMRIEHRPENAPGVFVTTAGFVEVGYAVGDVTPYARFERTDFPSGGDPFFSLGKLGMRGSFSSVVGGLKYTASDSIALKLEGSGIFVDAGTDIASVAFQCAFAF